jgi:hypothetical protein
VDDLGASPFRQRRGCSLTVMCREAKPHTPLKPSA